MPEPVVLEGPEAAKVWDAFWKRALPYGRKVAEICRTGEVACVMIEASIGGADNGVIPLDQRIRLSLIREFINTGDQVSADFLRIERPGRVFAFYQEGTFLLNLDLDGDPTKRESYSIEPGSLDVYKGRREDMLRAYSRDTDRTVGVQTLLNRLKGLRADGDFASTKINEMLRVIAINEVDKIEALIGPSEREFHHLLHDWARGAARFDTKGLDAKNKKKASDALGEEIHSEFVRRGLDRWIINGTSVRAVDHQPVKALASLMASLMFGLFTGRMQCPSGRWLEPGDIEKAIAEMILPPLVTPNNIEVAMMSLARFAAFIEADRSQDVIAVLKKDGPHRPIYEDSLFAALLDMIGFGTHWREMAFARLELGHKLAAALMFTDAPDPVQAPWLAWSLLLPDGLFGEVDVRRVWCLGDTPTVLLMKIGDHVGTLGLHVFNPKDGGLGIDPGPYNPEIGETKPRTREAFEAMGIEYRDKFLRVIPMLQNLVRGACLALSNPSEWRKGDYYGKASGSEIKKASKHKELPVGERYVLGQPVQIDLREEVLVQIRTGKVGGSSPTKLFLVRGHHRRQAHGPGHQLRKTIWIEPFWKGPEDARVLLRPYQT